MPVATVADPLPPPRARLDARAWLGVAALGLLTLALSWSAFTLTRFGAVAALWAANGLLTGALLLSHRRLWPAFFIASGLAQAGARLLVGDGLLMVAALSLLNLLESGLVAYWVRRHTDDLHRARSLGVVAQDAIGSTVVACLLSATLALPVLLTRAGATPLLAWGTWFTAHLLGMVVFATLTVCAFQQGVHLFGAKGRRLDFLGCLLALLVVCALAFGQTRYSLLFLVYLPLLLLSYRHGLSGMVVGIIVVAGISGITAAEGVGSFALAHTTSPVARLLYWQVYIAGGCLLAYGTAVAMTQRRQLEARLDRLARNDALTGLANRRHFEESLQEAVARATRTGSALMVLSLDLDRFKQINDTLGHAVGDEVLKEFGKRVRNAVYDVDLVARLGGDEFVVLVEYSAHAEAGERIARHILEAMAPPIDASTGPVQAATSIGIGLQRPVQSAEALLDLADKALYEAKRAGRNTWHLLQE